MQRSVMIKFIERSFNLIRLLALYKNGVGRINPTHPRIWKQSKPLIGRNEEIRQLERFLKTSKSEFVAIYGRRRVGKSYLVEEVYKEKIVFRAIGSYIKEKDEKTYKQTQLDHFYESLLDSGMSYL